MRAEILILAQGDQHRMGELAIPKQLLPVAGEPIIERTLRLLGGRTVSGQNAVIEGNRWIICDTQRHPQWLRLAREGWADLQRLPEPGRCILEGIGQTCDLWTPTGRTFIVLGDVCWSAAALAAVVADRRPLLFAGSSPVTPSEGEIYALAFDASMQAQVRAAVESAPCRRVTTYDGFQPGHLRYLLWSMTLAQYQQERGSPNSIGYRDDRAWCSPPACWLEISDFTTDIDTMEEARDLLPEIEAGIAAEGSGP